MTDASEANAEARATPKATVTMKVIRADGTEETYVSNDVTVEDAEAVSRLIEQMPEEDRETAAAEEAKARNEEESRRNLEANQRVAEAARGTD